MWLAPLFLFIVDLNYNDFLDARCKYTDEAFHWDVRRFSTQHNLTRSTICAKLW